MSLQSNFHSALRDPTLPTPSGLTGPKASVAHRRFNVYRNNVATSLIDALESGFPVIFKLLGEQNFRNIARDYQWQNPPSSPLMMTYGETFPDFLEGLEALAHIPYLSDVARLEYALRLSYHSADATLIAPQDLAMIPPENLPAAKLTFAPAVRVIRSRWPIFGIWEFNTRESAPKPVGRSESVLITRREFDPTPMLISEADAMCLRLLQNGTALGGALERVQKHAPDYDISALLGVLIGQGTITDITLPEGSA